MTAAVALSAQTPASQTFVPSKKTDNSLFFSTSGQGQQMPILWGLDTAWPDEANIRRGVRFIGAENIGIARVSFQPWDFMGGTTTLTDRLENNLKERLRLVSYIGDPGEVDLALNNDAPGDVYDTRYSNPATDDAALEAYCNLIYATTLSCQAKGWNVVSASPLNEPDYVYNGQGSKEDFLAIAKKLKTDYPQYNNGSIRISGGNTLNCDEALPWYEFLSEYIDEGNTHQLAGDFDHYADFFATVRSDGKYATADELHNVMEAMVGVEYGMQTGIWWGTAELARGEFCKASFGQRLAYAENRKAWTSAAVYQSPQGKTQAFVGSSERQAKPCSYRFVATDRDVFYDGHGPQREYVVDMPGGEGYQVEGQTNAECVVDITWGEDVRPVIDGSYILMNAYSKKLLSVDGTLENLSAIVQKSAAGDPGQVWAVTPTPITIGGDFSYYTIKTIDNPDMKLDILNFSLEEGGAIILYNGGEGTNEQWYLKYVGDGYFRILSRHSNMCLSVSDDSNADGVKVVQATPSEGNSKQLWRLLSPDAPCETEAPEPPTSLTATGQSASIRLQWNASPSADVSSYVVLRADGNSNEYNTIGRDLTSTEFIDNTITAGKEYHYKVKAIDRSLNSSTATTPVKAAAVSGNSMIACLKFNNSLEDSSENRFDAASYAKRVYYADGPSDGTDALSLTANRFVQLPYQVANHDALTICTWVLWRINGDGHLFNFGESTEKYMAFIPGYGNTSALVMKNGNSEQCLESAQQMPLKEWCHVAVCITADNSSIYINGKKAGEAIGGLGLTPNQLNPVLNYIGRNQEYDSTLDAHIHDFRIYNYALNQNEIEDIMQQSASIDHVATQSSPVVSTEYFNATGSQVMNPDEGIYIVRHKHADGSITLTKKAFTQRLSTH